MSDKKNDNIIQFPRGKKIQDISPGTAFLDAVKAIQETPTLPKGTPRKTSKKSQIICGDNNAQISDTKSVRQSITGNGNVQIAGTMQQVTVRAGRTPKIELTPPQHSIGANAVLRLRIEGLFKQINEYRHQRLGKNFKFGAIYGELAKAFGLKPADWRNVWLWDKSRAVEIISWLEAKRDNTIKGKIEKAASKAGYQHTRGHLFRLEKDYLSQLGWDDEQSKSSRTLMTGKKSRSDMSDNEFRSWVGYLRRELELMYGETDD
ncbi:hypothetical protein C3509_18035 [Salmonella enterica]|nr:hypothetical protein [Salmonella enterica]EED3332857.1 hypothetical protein [Salmonella enterica subsp. enterica]